MTNEFICDGENYELAGPKKDTIGLPVSLTGLPLTIELESLTLFLKTEFHVSLVCIGKIVQKNNIADPSFASKVLFDFCEFAKNNPIGLTGYRDEFRFATEAKKRSVVVMCNVSNLDKFFDLINKKYGLSLEYPTTHITLYTLQPDAGIFLASHKDIEDLTKPIGNPGIVLNNK